MIVNEQGKKYEFSKEFLLDMYSRTGILINPETGRMLPHELKIDLLTEGSELSQISIEDHLIEVVPETKTGDALALLLEGYPYRNNILHGDRSVFSDLSSPVGDGLTLTKDDNPISYDDLSSFAEFCLFHGYYDLYQDYSKDLGERFDDTSEALELLTVFIKKDDYDALKEYFNFYGIINTTIYEDLKRLLRDEERRGFKIDEKIEALREMNPDFNL